MKTAIRISPPAGSHLQCDSPNSVQLNNSTRYQADSVLNEASSQEDVYSTAVRPLVAVAAGGGQAVVTLVGGPKSGRSYTLCGNQKQMGLLPRAVEDMLKAGAPLLCSLVHIEREVLIDAIRANHKGPLHIQQGDRECRLKGATEVPIRRKADVFKVLRQARKRSPHTHQVWQLQCESGGSMLFILFSNQELPTQQCHSRGSHSALALILEAIALRRPTVPFHKCKLGGLMRGSLLGECDALLLGLISGAKGMKCDARTLEFLCWCRQASKSLRATVSTPRRSTAGSTPRRSTARSTPRRSTARSTPRRSTARAFEPSSQEPSNLPSPRSSHQQCTPNETAADAAVLAEVEAVSEENAALEERLKEVHQAISLKQAQSKELRLNWAIGAVSRLVGESDSVLKQIDVGLDADALHQAIGAIDSGRLNQGIDSKRKIRQRLRQIDLEIQEYEHWKAVMEAAVQRVHKEMHDAKRENKLERARLEQIEMNPAAAPPHTPCRSSCYSPSVSQQGFSTPSRSRCRSPSPGKGLRESSSRLSSTPRGTSQARLMSPRGRAPGSATRRQRRNSISRSSMSRSEPERNDALEELKTKENELESALSTQRHQLATLAAALESKEAKLAKMAMQEQVNAEQEKKTMQLVLEKELAAEHLEQECSRLKSAIASKLSELQECSSAVARLKQGFVSLREMTPHRELDGQPKAVARLDEEIQEARDMQDRLTKAIKVKESESEFAESVLNQILSTPVATA